MAYVKTNWQDRAVQRPRTYMQVTNTDGSVTLIPAEGVIYNEGTPVTAARMNKIEEGIYNNDCALQNLAPIKRNELKMLLGTAGKFSGVNAWSDDLNDASWLNTGASSGYVLNSGKIILNTSQQYTKISTDNAIKTASSGTASNAFDGNTETGWTPTPNGTTFLKIQFSSPKTVAKMRVYEGYYGSTSTYLDWSIYGSNDNSSWIVITTIHRSYHSDNSWTDIIINSSAPYTYYKIEYTSSDQPRLYIYEWEFYEGWYYSNATAIWQPKASEGILKQAIIEADQTLNTGTITYYISRDNGTTFTQCPPDTLVDISGQPPGTNIVLKAVITGDAQINGVAWGGLIGG